MAEPKTEETSETEEQETEETQERQSESADDVEAMKRALKKANKEAEAARLKVKEFEDASKSDQEKANERAAAAEQRAEKAESNYLRMKVAMEKGLPPKLAARLQGSTEEELASDADDLLATVGGKRTPDFDGGSRQSTNTSSESFLTRAIRERR